VPRGSTVATIFQNERIYLKGESKIVSQKRRQIMAALLEINSKHEGAT